MGQSRKTVGVKQLVEYANKQLARTDEYATKEFKSGICVMIGEVLHRSNNYNGFLFINNDDSEIDTVGYYSRIYTIPNKLK